MKSKKICTICDLETNGTDTCSYEHGIIWRYLKKFNLNKQEIQEIINVNTKHNLQVKYKLWLQNLKEEPKCLICGSNLSFKKLISTSITSKYCSKKCFDKTKEKKEKLSQKEISLNRELSKTNENIEEYKKELDKLYPTVNDYLIKNRLYKANLKEIPICKFCGKEHVKHRNGVFKDCCSKECANSYNKSKISYNEILKYYNKTVPKDFLKLIDKYELSSIYSNKKRKMDKCNCGKWFIDKCEKHCNTKQHFNNLKEFNKEGFERFIVNDLFDLKEAMEYYRCSEKTIRRYLEEFEIQNRTSFSVESYVDDAFDINFNRNDRKFISPKEIDLLSEDYKFGIEYNGLMWHSYGKNKSKLFDNLKYENKNKHLTKTELVESKGYQLFHIFENEWLNKKEIWKSVINSKINKTNRIYARKCIIKEVPSFEAKQFENKNHLQGSGISSIRIGLYYKDELVSIMTFGKSRFNKSIEYELIRFCSKLNTTIIGGASKLLNYFEKNYNPKSLISYANRRWSQGNLYEKLGFEFVNNTNANYFYFHESNINMLYSRVNFQKHKLKDKLKIFDEKLTETENMYNNGYRKIYDCGNKVYIKKY